MNIGLCYDTQDDYEAMRGYDYCPNFISINTIRAIKIALEDCGFDVEMIDGLASLQAVLSDKDANSIDLFFNIIEGSMSRSREAFAPALLELNGKPHTGSDAAGVCYAMNKHLTKLIAQEQGILVPQGFVFDELTFDVLNKVNGLGYPVVLKANCDEGSVSNALVANDGEFVAAYKKDIAMGHQEWIVETYIPGKEITVPVLEDQNGPHAMGVVLILCEDGSDVAFYDSAKKDDDDFITNTLDFKCPEDACAAMKSASETMHRCLGLHDYSRCDFRLDDNGQPYFLEINPLTALNRKGSFETCGQAQGLRYHEVIQQIVNNSLQRNGLR